MEDVEGIEMCKAPDCRTIKPSRFQIGSLFQIDLKSEVRLDQSIASTGRIEFKKPLWKDRPRNEHQQMPWGYGRENEQLGY
jgi:hypothetical protein